MANVVSIITETTKKLVKSDGTEVKVGDYCIFQTRSSGIVHGTYRGINASGHLIFEELLGGNIYETRVLPKSILIFEVANEVKRG